MSVEAWNASQGMLDHWAFLDREGQHEDDRSRTVLDAEPVLDLLERARNPVYSSCGGYTAELGAMRDDIDAFLRTHGRLK